MKISPTASTAFATLASTLTCLGTLVVLGGCTTPTPAVLSSQSTRPAARLVIASDLTAQGQALSVSKPAPDSSASPSATAASASSASSASALSLQFGPFSARDLSLRWPRERDFLLVSPLQLAQAKQKFSFTQHSSEDQRAEVLAMTTFRNAGFRWVNGALTGDIHQTSFAGSVTPARPTPATPPPMKSLSGLLNHGEFAWEFIVYNLDGGEGSPVDSGMIQDSLGNQILIRALRQLEGQPASPNNLGFEYVQNGLPIGAVSTSALTTPQQIWLRQDLSSDLKLALSSVSSALLMRLSMPPAATPSATSPTPR